MRKLLINNKGFVGITIIVLTLLLVGVGGVGWYVYSKNQQSDTTAKKAPTADFLQQKTTSPKFLSIEEWGVKLPLSNEIDDTYYVVSTSTHNSDGQRNTVWLGIRSLDKFSTCLAENAIKEVRLWLE